MIENLKNLFIKKKVHAILFGSIILFYLGMQLFGYTIFYTYKTDRYNKNNYSRSNYNHK